MLSIGIGLFDFGPLRRDQHTVLTQPRRTTAKKSVYVADNKTNDNKKRELYFCLAMQMEKAKEHDRTHTHVICLITNGSHAGGDVGATIDTLS